MKSTRETRETRITRILSNTGRGKTVKREKPNIINQRDERDERDLTHSIISLNDIIKFLYSFNCAFRNPLVICEQSLTWLKKNLSL